jgi:nucleoid DNA-binding protein
MNKEIIAQVKVVLGLPNLVSAKFTVNAVMTAVSDQIQANGTRLGWELRIPGLGTFRVRSVEARTGRNPATGEILEIPARTRVVFKPIPAIAKLGK